MARDLSIYLNGPTSVEFVDLDPGDERLNAIRAAYDNSKWGEAADLATNLAGEGIFDITPISFALYGTFRQEGIGAIGAIFDVVDAAFGQNFTAIGPRERRETHFTTRIIWLFGTMRDNLEYYQKKGGPDWKTLSEKVMTSRIHEIVGHGKSLESDLIAAKRDKVAVSLAGLVTMLRDVAKIFEQQEAQLKAAAAAKTNVTSAANTPPSTTVTNSNTDVEFPDDDDSDDEPVAATAENNVTPVVATKGASKRTVTLRVSPQFLDFMAKLHAFETLVSRGQHMKAAIVAEDIQNILEHFDPRVYFPDLLSRFSQLLCEHTDELEEGLRFQNSFAWKTATQFYQVDLDKFTNGKKG